jgi:hypothetical protein
MTRIVATVALLAAVAAVGLMTTPSFAQAAASHKARGSAQHARPLYNMVPGGAPVNGRDDPAFTGGGSLGYNQMIYNW